MAEELPIEDAPEEGGDEFSRPPSSSSSVNLLRPMAITIGLQALILAVLGSCAFWEWFPQTAVTSAVLSILVTSIFQSTIMVIMMLPTLVLRKAIYALAFLNMAAHAFAIATEIGFLAIGIQNEFAYMRAVTWAFWFGMAVGLPAAIVADVVGQAFCWNLENPHVSNRHQPIRITDLLALMIVCAACFAVIAWIKNPNYIEGLLGLQERVISAFLIGMVVLLPVLCWLGGFGLSHNRKRAVKVSKVMLLIAAVSLLCGFIYRGFLLFAFVLFPLLLLGLGVVVTLISFQVSGFRLIYTGSSASNSADG